MDELNKTEAGAELVAEVLRRFGAARVRVLGSSMLPTIRPGDELEVERAGLETMKPGAVVLFRRGERLFAHRIVRAGGGALQTKGDALVEQDPPVAEKELLGRVAEIRRGGKRIRLDSFGQRLWARLAPWSGYFIHYAPRPARRLARALVLPLGNDAVA